MEDFFKVIIYIVFFVIWILSFIKKKPAESQDDYTTPDGYTYEPDNEKTNVKTKSDLEELFESFEFPQPVKKPQPQTAPKEYYTKPKLDTKAKETLKQEKKSIDKEPAKQAEKMIIPLIEEPTEGLNFEDDKLEEGIILSEVLGRPKAYQFIPRP